MVGKNNNFIKESIMKTLAKLGLITMLGMLSASAFAGKTWRIKIVNNTDHDLVMERVNTSCWYAEDFRNGRVIRAGDYAYLYTEDKASSSKGDFCLTSHRHMTFDLIGAKGVRYPLYLSWDTSKREGSWGHDYPGRETDHRNRIEGPQGGKTYIDFTMYMTQQVCPTSKDRYLACMFPKH